MIALPTIRFGGLLASVLLACSFANPAAALEVSGIKFDDTAKVAGKELVLNGAGIRTRFMLKVYATGIYLPEKAKTVPEVMKMDGPRRITLVIMRDISSDAFGNAFMSGLNGNLDQADKAKIIPQISKFGEMFATLDGLKKGDVLHLDYTPGSGTQCHINGRKIGEVAPELLFYNAILRIWLGDKPVDSSLKPALLGGA